MFSIYSKIFFIYFFSFFKSVSIHLNFFFNKRNWSFRIIGFLFGFSLASSYAAYHLLEEYKLASAALQASVDELKVSTEKVGHSMMDIAN